MEATEYADTIVVSRRQVPRRLLESQNAARCHHNLTGIYAGRCLMPRMLTTYLYAIVRRYGRCGYRSRHSHRATPPVCTLLLCRELLVFRHLYVVGISRRYAGKCEPVLNVRCRFISRYGQATYWHD